MADVAAENSKGKADEDDLDELLDNALEDFDKASKPAAKATNQPESSSDGTEPPPVCPPVKTVGEPTSSSTTGDEQDELNKMFAQSFAEAATDLEKAMKTMMGDTDQDFMSHLNHLTQSAASAAKQENPESMETFETNLSRTLSDLTQNTKDMENMDPMGEDFLKAMSGMGAGDGGDMDMMPLMHGMMKNLMSKEVLYPSLKDMNDKYPDWLENNKSSHPKEEHDRYTKQYELVNKICQEYEAEKEQDSEDDQKKRFERIMEMMHQMQECGQPPEELLGEVAPGMPFGADPGAGNMPMPDLPADLQEQCKVS